MFLGDLNEEPGDPPGLLPEQPWKPSSQNGKLLLNHGFSSIIAVFGTGPKCFQSVPGQFSTSLADSECSSSLLLWSPWTFLKPGNLHQKALRQSSLAPSE